MGTGATTHIRLPELLPRPYEQSSGAKGYLHGSTSSFLDSPKAQATARVRNAGKEHSHPPQTFSVSPPSGGFCRTRTPPRVVNQSTNLRCTRIQVTRGRLLQPNLATSLTCAAGPPRVDDLHAKTGGVNILLSATLNWHGYHLN